MTPSHPSSSVREAPVFEWIQASSVTTKVMLVLFGTLLLTLSAKVHIPFWPVPLTMQTFVVLLIGMTYGTRLAGATLLLYLGEGAIGLPVFSGTPERGLGLAYLAGPTGGFLVGFFFAAVLLGWLAERGWRGNVWLITAAMILGHAVIFATGLLWLSMIVGWAQAWTLGAMPFVLATIVKTVLGVVTVVALSRLSIER
jgi:biotin transport system substrate-specific component